MNYGNPLSQIGDAMAHGAASLGVAYTPPTPRAPGPSAGRPAATPARTGPTLITVKQAAEILGVAEHTVRVLISRRALRDHAPGQVTGRRGGRPRVELEQVRERARRKAPKSIQQLRFENAERTRRSRERKLARDPGYRERENAYSREHKARKRRAGK